MTDRLIFIRHSQSRPAPGLAPSHYPLTELGRRRCRALAARLAAYAPDLIVASDERKTRETAALTAAHMGLPHVVAPDLHEHRREQVGWLAQEQFDASVQAGFAQPDARVFGEETFNQARDRFAGGVRAALAQHAGHRIAIVTHGTVLALFIAQHAGVAAMPFWHSLGMPAIVVVALPGYRLLEVVEQVRK